METANGACYLVSFTRTTPISEALAGYFSNAQPGDLIKAHDRFAFFSEDLRWEGNLTALRPGEGYLFRRLGLGTVVIPFYHQTTDHAPKKMQETELKTTDHFHNPAAATNMTMIAKVEGLSSLSVAVYIGNELAAVAEPVGSLYFLTIQSDKIGELRFELDGQELIAKSQEPIAYQANAHYGSPEDPIILQMKKCENEEIRKLIENDHVIIIRNGERYDVTGKKL